MVVIICAFVIEGIEIYVDVVNLINYNIFGVHMCKSCVHATCTNVNACTTTIQLNLTITFQYASAS